MVFQDPAESLNTRMTVGSILREPLDIHNIGTKNERPRLVRELLEKWASRKVQLRDTP